jgi:galactose mutarotase-like enzyme
VTSERSLATVTLRDEESSLEATFVPGAGMLCASLCHRGDELLAQNAGVAAYAERGATMGIPLLYPWANRLAAFEYKVGGRAVEVPHDPGLIALDTRGLPIHGVIGGRLAWTLTDEVAAGTGSLSARLEWREAERERFEVFPFEHDLAYDVRVTNGLLELEVTVSACGRDAVPLAFGFHPYLSLPGTPRERWLVELPAMRHLELDRDQIPTGGGEEHAARRFELAEDKFDDGFDSLAAPAHFSVAAEGRRIEVAFMEGYPCAQVFAPLGKEFICFEPMTAPANALRSGSGLRAVAPGEQYRATFAVAVDGVPG